MGFIHCKHYNGRDLFNGSTGGKCLAGVDPIYSFCDGDQTGWVKKVPCLMTNNAEAICPAAEYPTVEEEKQREEDLRLSMAELIENLTAVRPLIEKQHVKTGDWSGQVDCPKCSKPLHWRKLQCNGHIHAQCETDDCIAWME